MGTLSAFINLLSETLWQHAHSLFHVADSLRPELGAGIADVAGEDFGLFVFMILVAAGVCLLAIISVIAVVGILLILISAFGLGALGLSIISGLRARSLRNGFRTFCISFSAACGALASILLAWLAALVFDFQMDFGVSVAALGAGAVAGGCMGWLLFKLLRLLLNWIGRRVRIPAR